jgi:lipopolysaccharide/colanic/teichoic acid biosynthesis glycosyltransferase
MHEASSANQLASVDRSPDYRLAYNSDSRTKAVVTEPFLKRPLDVMLSTMMMILPLPAFPLFFLAIKLEDRGPIFYRQERWGLNGSCFKSFKFRTMVRNSDHDYGIKQASENDPRITKVGRILRAMGLDELPQVINIFRGDMSFVGPRSLAVGEIVKDGRGNVVEYEDVPFFWERLSVRPGLTGLATVYLPSDVPPRRKFRYDLLYIRKQSFWLDLRLIFLSFWISFRGKWETRGKKT